MNVQAAVELLGLRSKGPAGKLRVNDPWEKFEQATNAWKRALTGLQTAAEPMSEAALFASRDLRDVSRAERRMQAWDTLLGHWCPDCECIAIRFHMHCMQCGSIMRPSKSSSQQDVVVEVHICTTCGRQEMSRS